MYCRGIKFKNHNTEYRHKRIDWITNDDAVEEISKQYNITEELDKIYYILNSNIN